MWTRYETVVPNLITGMNAYSDVTFVIDRPGDQAGDKGQPRAEHGLHPVVVRGADVRRGPPDPARARGSSREEAEAAAGLGRRADFQLAAEAGAASMTQVPAPACRTAAPRALLPIERRPNRARLVTSTRMPSGEERGGTPADDHGDRHHDPAGLKKSFAEVHLDRAPHRGDRDVLRDDPPGRPGAPGRTCRIWCGPRPGAPAAPRTNRTSAPLARPGSERNKPPRIVRKIRLE